LAPKRPLRRKYLIKPAYQLKIAFTLAVAFILYSMVLAFILFYPLFQELQSSVSIEEQARISNIVLYLHARLWPAIFIVAVLVGLGAVFSSHRVFGPIYRFEAALKAFLKGDFSGRIKLRKHDNLKEMEGLFNEVAAYLEKEKSVEKNLHRTIKARLKEVSEILLSGDKAAAGQARAILLGVIKEMEAKAS